MSGFARESFRDLFSACAGDYQTFRPTYPADLFDYLAALTPSPDVAWDCATGNGQAAIGLAEHFRRVIATDGSRQQLLAAMPVANVDYLVATAEQPALRDGSIDLVLVAQAAHWFQLERFFGQVRRALKPRGVIALVCYGLMHISPEIDSIIERFYGQIVGPYWPPERRLIETGYRTLRFPFDELGTPDLAMKLEWNLPHLIGYLGTWSAVNKYREVHGADPRLLVADELTAAWGDPAMAKPVSWPLALRVGRVP